MKANASDTENYVNGVMKEAKFLADELSYMTQSGDKLANRLEKVADRNKELITLIEKSGGIGEPPMSRTVTAPAEDDDNPFEIFDVDLDDDLDADDEADFLALEDGTYDARTANAPTEKGNFSIFDKEFSSHSGQNGPQPQPKKQKEFYSQAEQDLYEALQRRRHIQETS